MGGRRDKDSHGQLLGHQMSMGFRLSKRRRRGRTPGDPAAAASGAAGWLFGRQGLLGRRVLGGARRRLRSALRRYPAVTIFRLLPGSNSGRIGKLATYGTAMFYEAVEQAEAAVRSHPKADSVPGSPMGLRIPHVHDVEKNAAANGHGRGQGRLDIRDVTLSALR